MAEENISQGFRLEIIDKKRIISLKSQNELMPNKTNKQTNKNFTDSKLH